MNEVNLKIKRCDKEDVYVSLQNEPEMIKKFTNEFKNRGFYIKSEIRSGKMLVEISIEKN